MYPQIYLFFKHRLFINYLSYGKRMEYSLERYREDAFKERSDIIFGPESEPLITQIDISNLLIEFYHLAIFFSFAF